MSSRVQSYGQNVQKHPTITPFCKGAQQSQQQNFSKKAGNTTPTTLGNNAALQTLAEAAIDNESSLLLLFYCGIKRRCGVNSLRSELQVRPQEFNGGQ